MCSQFEAREYDLSRTSLRVIGHRVVAVVNLVMGETDRAHAEEIENHEIIAKAPGLECELLSRPYSSLAYGARAELRPESATASRRRYRA